jgi:phosphoglucosamine mutase
VALKYFGTDGVRGRAFEPPLTIEEVRRWGCAWASVAKESGTQTLVIGWDGRASCDAFLRAFLTGFGDAAKTLLLGVVPTPAVAWVASRQANAWGLVLSASHNPPEDNGIKGFDSKGAKLPEDVEHAIESAFDAASNALVPKGKDLDPAIHQEDMEEYLTRLGGMCFPDSFPVVIDCAHGATAPWAPRLFKGAVQWIGTPTDGERINVGVGSGHLDALRKQVFASNVAAGVAFDGDGDRCLILDNEGEVIDGDQMLWLLTKELKQGGSKPPGVVGTVMSNGGLEQGLNELGVPFVRTPVGDKYLGRELDGAGWDMAAEPSGHLIQRHVGPSGDGMAAALAVLRVIVEKPAERRWDWRFVQWPLRLVNIRAKQRKEIGQCPTLQKAIHGAKQEHGDSIRLVVRWSGTEPLLRLMAEAKEQWQVEQAVGRLVDAAKADLLT